MFFAKKRICKVLDHQDLTLFCVDNFLSGRKRKRIEKDSIDYLKSNPKTRSSQVQISDDLLLQNYHENSLWNDFLTTDVFPLVKEFYERRYKTCHVPPMMLKRVWSKSVSKPYQDEFHKREKDSIISGIYYIEANREADTIFKYENGDELEAKSIKNRLILFPGRSEHHMRFNVLETKKDRLTLHFDFVLNDDHLY